LIGDRAYDTDRLDHDLAERCATDMIARIAESAGRQPKIIVAVIVAVGEWKDLSLGSIIFAGS
jgi:hypothetical protein